MMKLFASVISNFGGHKHRVLKKLNMYKYWNSLYHWYHSFESTYTCVKCAAFYLGLFDSDIIWYLVFTILLWASLTNWLDMMCKFLVWLINTLYIHKVCCVWWKSIQFQRILVMCLYFGKPCCIADFFICRSI